MPRKRHAATLRSLQDDNSLLPAEKETRASDFKPGDIVQWDENWFAQRFFSHAPNEVLARRRRWFEKIGSQDKVQQGPKGQVQEGPVGKVCVIWENGRYAEYGEAPWLGRLSSIRLVD